MQIGKTAGQFDEKGGLSRPGGSGDEDIFPTFHGYPLKPQRLWVYRISLEESATTPGPISKNFNIFLYRLFLDSIKQEYL
jgi:hypothetical protein